MSDGKHGRVWRRCRLEHVQIRRIVLSDVVGRWWLCDDRQRRLLKLLRRLLRLLGRLEVVMLHIRLLLSIAVALPLTTSAVVVTAASVLLLLGRVLLLAARSLPAFGRLLLRWLLLLSRRLAPQLLAQVRGTGGELHFVVGVPAHVGLL